MRHLSCHRQSNPASTTHIVFLKAGHDHDDQPLKKEEFGVAEAIKRAEALAEPIIERQGYRITSDQRLEAGRLGVRKSFQRVIPELLDQRIIERYRKEVFPEEKHEDHIMEKHPHFTAPPGFFGKVRHFFKKRFQKETTLRFEETFGPEKTATGMGMRLAYQVLQHLSADDRQAVQNFLEGKGVLPVAAPQALPAWLPAGDAVLQQQVLMLAGAQPDVISLMDTDDHLRSIGLFPTTGTHFLFPNRKFIPPPTPIERFLQLKKIEGQERAQQESTSLYEPQRLMAVLKEIDRSHHDLHHTLLHDVLEHDALFRTANKPDSLALLHYLEQRIDMPNGPESLHTELKQISESIPKVKAVHAHGEHEHGTHAEKKENEEKKDELKELETQTEKVVTNYGQLSDLYANARTLGRELFNLRKKSWILTKQQDTSNKGGSGNKQSQNTAETERSIKEKETEKRQMFKEIRLLEDTFGKDASTLSKTLIEKEKIPAAGEGYATIQKFIRSFVDEPPERSTEEGIFGKTDPDDGTKSYDDFNADVNGKPFSSSPFPALFQGDFKPKDLKAFKKEIEEKYHKKFKEPFRLSPFELLVRLMENEAERVGIHDQALRGADALAAAHILVGRAGNAVQINRSANLEHQEWLSSGPITRAKKWIGSKMSMGTYNAEDLIRYLGGFEKFALFRHLPKHATVEEIIEHISHHGDLKDPEVLKLLLDFELRLREVFLKFEAPHYKGKIKLFERDAYDIERLANTLTSVRAVLRSQNFYDKVSDLHGDKAEIILQKLREDRIAVAHDEQTIWKKATSRSAEWKTWFSKKQLKNIFLDKLVSAKKHQKERHLSSDEFEKHLEHEGLISAYDKLRFTLAKKEAIELGIKGVESGGKVVTRIVSGGEKIATAALEKVLKPAGKEVIVKPAKWVANKIAWTAKLPFVVAGTILGGAWNMVKPGKRSGGHGADTHGGGHGGGH